MRLGYLVARFPKVSETFVLNEIVGIERRGAHVDLYALRRERQPVVHPAAAVLTERARFAPIMSRAVLTSSVVMFFSRPWRCLGAFVSWIRGTASSMNFLLGAIAYFPKALAFARWAEQDRIEHLHAHFASHSAAVALCIHRLTGIPFSFTAHGSDVHKRQAYLREKVRAAEFVVTISEFNRRFILDCVGDDYRTSVHVVHCGVDTSRFAPCQPGSDPPPLHVICVASLEPVKGHRYLIDASRELKDRGVAALYQFVGDGPERARLEARARDVGVTDIVHFLGPQPTSTVQSLLGAAHCFVLASVATRAGSMEGIPVALMEAMATGLPVVASRQSGIPELVHHEINGLLVEPGDSTALAHCLERLAASRALRDRLGARGRETVSQDFDIEGQVDGVWQLLVNSRGGASKA